MTATTRCLALLLTLGLAAPAHAAPPLVDYVVKDGDTCQAIARKIYGDSKHLRLLHANNKLGPLPHKLKAGMILKVPASAEPEPAPTTSSPTTSPPTTSPPTTPAPAPPPAAPPTPGPDALLTFLRNEVDAYTPEQHPGQRDEPLHRGHRVNTHAASSAEITFADTSRIQLGEESLIVILGNTRTRARTSGKPEDTTLVTGSLRAHLGGLAGKPRPLAVATPTAEVALEPGETQLDVDAEQSTRLAVHRGSARLRARDKTVNVPEQHGSKAAKGKPPTPPRPLPAAPVWTTPPPLFVLQTDPAPISGVYGPGLGLPGAPLPATWHVQLARDERFNDLVVDTRVPADITRLELRVPAGRYHARVSGIDGDQFEGRASEPAPVTLATVQTTPASAGQPAQLSVTPGTWCALDDGPLQLVEAPLALSPDRAHDLRCAADVTGAGATTLEIPRAAPPPLAALVPPKPAPLPPPPPAPLPPVAPPPLGPLGNAGIGLLAASIPLAALGLGLTVSDLRPYHDDPLRRIDLRPAGLTTLAFTPILLVSGVTLLALDRRQQRRLHLAPQATPSSAGLLLHGRF